MWKLLITVLLITAVAGCGGGGGGGSATPTGNVTRQIQAGDVVHYALTGTENNGGQISQVSGTATLTTYVDNRVVRPVSLGYRALKVVNEMTFTDSGGSVHLVKSAFGEQSADGTLYDFGIEGRELLASSVNPVMYPGLFAAGMTWSWSGSYSDNSTESNSYNIVGLETVLGRQAYHIHESDSVKGTTEDEWFVPDLGYFIKTTFTVTGDDGITYNLTLSMTGVTLH